MGVNTKTFIHDIGVEPISFIGFTQTEVDLEVDNSRHSLDQSAEINVSILLDVENGIHSPQSPLVKPTLQLNETDVPTSQIHKVSATPLTSLKVYLIVSNGVHKHYISNKINAPVVPVCGRYLDTPFQDRVLQTPIGIC